MAVYHPGKVIAVYRPDKENVISESGNVQALIEMWDELLFTCDVSDKLKDRINVGDIVLIDYTPFSDKINTPKQIIIKILKKEVAEKTWETYKEHYRKKTEGRQRNNPPNIYG